MAYVMLVVQAHGYEGAQVHKEADLSKKNQT